MKDAVIFHPARAIGETAGAAVEMGQNELATEYTESAHPYKQLAEVLHIADETKNRTGYVLFPKVTKFNTWLLSRYGKRLEAELTEGIMAGKYAVTMGLNDVTAAHISCRFSPRMSLWRVNRYEFIADVPVEISWKSSAGEETAAWTRISAILLTASVWRSLTARSSGWTSIWFPLCPTKILKPQRGRCGSSICLRFSQTMNG